MSLPDFKSIRKLADICRKAGIKSFKNADFEFTLTDDAPISNYKRRKSTIQTDTTTKPVDSTFKSDSISNEALLFWSTQDLDEADNENI